MSEQEFLQLIRQHQGIIYKLAALYAADEEEKKDFCQEILLQAWKSFTRFRYEAKFSTWLYRVSLNTLLTIQRKERIIDYRDSLDALENRATTGSGISPEAAALEQAIRRLPETDRALISMHLDGYNHDEIAETIGINKNHVAVKLHRIKQQLSQILNPEK